MIEVVHMDSGGRPSSHATTIGSGSRRIRAETTLVSSTITIRSRLGEPVNAQLGNILRKTQTGEAGSEPRAEQCPSAALVPDRVAEDLADFLFSAVTMAACAALKLGLHVVFEVSDQELSHGAMIARYQQSADGQSESGGALCRVGRGLGKPPTACPRGGPRRGTGAC